MLNREYTYVTINAALKGADAMNKIFKIKGENNLWNK